LYIVTIDNTIQAVPNRSSVLWTADITGTLLSKAPLSLTECIHRVIVYQECFKAAVEGRFRTIPERA